MIDIERYFVSSEKQGKWCELAVFQILCKYYVYQKGFLLTFQLRGGVRWTSEIMTASTSQYEQ